MSSQVGASCSPRRPLPVPLQQPSRTWPSRSWLPVCHGGESWQTRCRWGPVGARVEVQGLGPPESVRLTCRLFGLVTGQSSLLRTEHPVLSSKEGPVAGFTSEAGPWEGPSAAGSPGWSSGPITDWLRAPCKWLLLPESQCSAICGL